MQCLSFTHCPNDKQMFDKLYFRSSSPKMIQWVSQAQEKKAFFCEKIPAFSISLDAGEVSFKWRACGLDLDLFVGHACH